MENRDIYPEKWLREKVVKISNNVMVIDSTDKDVLYMQSARKDFNSTMEYVRRMHHPFDEITYLLTAKDENGKEHEFVADVKNNLTSDFHCVMRFIVEGELVGFYALSDTQQVISPLEEGGMNLIKGIGAFTKRINELVGCFAITRRNNKVSRKTGEVKSSVHTTSIDSKPRTIRLRDISELQLSTYVEGGGSKPSHEFGVRGHVRHYKNGKEVFIKPYTKCKGRGKNPPQFYKVN